MPDLARSTATLLVLLAANQADAYPVKCSVVIPGATAKDVRVVFDLLVALVDRHADSLPVFPAYAAQLAALSYVVLEPIENSKLFYERLDSLSLDNNRLVTRTRRDAE